MKANQVPKCFNLLVACAALAGAVMPSTASAEVAIVVVDVVAVADGYRFSELKGNDVMNPKGETIGELDDLMFVGKDRVVFAIIEVGGFLGIGSHLIAVPFKSLEISNGGKRIVLPGASKEQVKGLPEFKYKDGSTRSK
jgi:sporulation protein YlmC with PRC-barrel domain